MTNLFEIIDELLVSGHPAVIHFPIIGVVMGMMAAVSALLLGILIDIDSFESKSWVSKPWFKKLIDRFEFASWIMLIMGQFGLIITLLDANTLLAATRCTSAFPNGEVAFVEDSETPPNRAYLKLWEALTLLGAAYGYGHWLRCQRAAKTDSASFGGARRRNRFWPPRLWLTRNEVLQ